MAHLIVACETLKVAGAYAVPGTRLGESVRWPKLYDLEIPDATVEELTDAMLPGGCYLDLTAVEQSVLEKLADTGVSSMPFSAVRMAAAPSGRNRLEELEGYRLPEKVAFLEWHRARGVRMARENEVEILLARNSSPRTVAAAKRLAKANVEAVAALAEMEREKLDNLARASETSAREKPARVPVGTVRSRG